ncbi:PrgI family protein [Lachnospiraceae bacterium 48-21]
MDIELSEDLQHYKESFVLGLTVKQAFFSMLALGAGAAVVLLLYEKIGITLSCYVATPFVVPLALTGFYNYHGLSFWQFMSKLLYYTLFNRPLLYGAGTVEELKNMFLEKKQEQKKKRRKMRRR